MSGRAAGRRSSRRHEKRAVAERPRTAKQQEGDATLRSEKAEKSLKHLARSLGSVAFSSKVRSRLRSTTEHPTLARRQTLPGWHVQDMFPGLQLGRCLGFCGRLARYDTSTQSKQPTFSSATTQPEAARVNFSIGKRCCCGWHAASHSREARQRQGLVHGRTALFAPRRNAGEVQLAQLCARRWRDFVGLPPSNEETIAHRFIAASGHPKLQRRRESQAARVHLTKHVRPYRNAHWSHRKDAGACGLHGLVNPQHHSGPEQGRALVVWAAWWGSLCAAALILPIRPVTTCAARGTDSLRRGPERGRHTRRAQDNTARVRGTDTKLLRRRLPLTTVSWTTTEKTLENSSVVDQIASTRPTWEQHPRFFASRKPYCNALGDGWLVSMGLASSPSDAGDLPAFAAGTLCGCQLHPSEAAGWATEPSVILDL